MMRSGADFSDDQVLLASWIQPTLKVLSELRRTQFAADGKRLATEEWELTKRESEVAALLGQGLSADSIGRMLGISPRTVRKHLERVYAKSGLHDRLLVVQRLSS